MSRTQHFVVFTLDQQYYALPLSHVERVVRAVEVTAVPNAPEVILGVVNVQGTIIPVVDLRRRFDLPRRAISLSDRLIIARTSRQTIGLVADTVGRVVEWPVGNIIAADQIVHGLEDISGVARIEDQIVFIQNLDTLLFPEEQALVDALSHDGREAYDE
jgi:purine-binding chemotaxis protein CheW